MKARSGSACEHCAGRRGVQIHHRRPRGMGGTRRADSNSPAALLHLCLECHGLIESRREWALANGLLIRQNADPALTAVLLGGRNVLLDNEGRYLPAFDDN
ncbi:hypothetical protein NWFMUON74_61070 [Nocardia wallacei]|uniref:HNH domain-containing protein n=1 Tax=Nocardia wallacei TaxID=480035 RepID=A0A7G1KSX5_9NOCA|nr:hypothetical protein NWFMUON74_61070 [Nocardia wallacei]